MRRSYRAIGYIGSTFRKFERLQRSNHCTDNQNFDELGQQTIFKRSSHGNGRIPCNTIATMAVKQPQVQRIDRDNVTGIIQAIIDDGCCVIKNFTSVETINNVNAEAQPYLDADKPWKVCRFQTSMRKPWPILSKQRVIFSHQKLGDVPI